MKKYFSGGDVAQGRYLEGAAQFAPLREIRPGRSAQPKVVIRRIPIRQQRRVSWHAQIVEAKVGKQGGAAVGRLGAWMAGRAVAFGRTVEQRQAAQLTVAQGRLASDKSIIFCVEGMKLRVLFLVLLQCQQHPLESRCRIIENRSAEKCTELLGIGCRTQFGDNSRRVGIGHFMRRQQRAPGLLGQCLGAAITVETAARCTVGSNRKARRQIQVAQRRRRA